MGREEIIGDCRLILSELEEAIKAAKHNMEQYTPDSPVWFYWKGQPSITKYYCKFHGDANSARNLRYYYKKKALELNACNNKQEA